MCFSSPVNVGIVAKDSGIVEEVEQEARNLLGSLGFAAVGSHRFEKADFDCFVEMEWDEYNALAIIVYRLKGFDENAGELAIDNLSKLTREHFESTDISTQVQIVELIVMVE